MIQGQSWRVRVTRERNTVSAKGLTIIFFALMLSAATLASEKQRCSEMRVEADAGQQISDDMKLHEMHEIRVVRVEVDVTN